MLIDLHHNKIVDSLITEGFERSVGENLLPRLLEKHGESLLGIQMYEDYINDKLLFDGEWYYPLTLITDGGAITEWIKWRFDKKNFEGGMPYAYTGEENIDFSIAEAVPDDFVRKIEGRAIFAEAGLVKVVASATSPDVAFLSGKCSQTFIDELARQIGPAIEKFLSVSGLADSSLSLLLAFAPGTYMEHTSEKVTYRRLLLSDGVSAPRDLWIKWTRLDGEGAFTVASNPRSGEILFELGEDVPRKVCEKEYRFLLGKGKDGYHRAMGRKNITEWREIIKRAIRRGELMNAKDMNEISEETRALDAMLAEVLGVDVSEKQAVEETPVIEAAEDADDEFSLAMKFVRETALGESVTESAEEEKESEGDDIFFSFDEEAESDESKEQEASEEQVDTSNEDDELLMITQMAREALLEAEENEYCEALEEDGEVDFEEDAEYDVCAAEPNESDVEDAGAVPAAAVPLGPTEKEYEELAEKKAATEEKDGLTDGKAAEVTAESTRAMSAELEERIRREVEARLRLEYEREARVRAEAEAERLRVELEKMKEVQALLERERERAERERLAEMERLRATVEQQMRAEAKERERLAEAARLAVLEKQRLDEQMERERRELQVREADEARAEEQRRIEEERRQEAERIRREAEERTERAEATVSNKSTDYTYVSKLVKLRFRRSVDPNITTRIYEIIKATIEYYGKEKVYLRIKASVPDTETVNLEFVEIPLEEMELLSNIIKVLGNSGLGIAKAIVE